VTVLDEQTLDGDIVSTPQMGRQSPWPSWFETPAFAGSSP
jgi:hypothetical protein